MAASARPSSTACGLSASLTLRNTLPSVGRPGLAAACAFAKAIPRSASRPITSPVERISGPSAIVAPGEPTKGNTASFTHQCFGATSRVKPSSESFIPVITFAASFASGTPIALATKGTVRDARGLTSSTYSWPSLIANWTFMRPTTFSSRASAWVAADAGQHLPAERVRRHHHRRVAGVDAGELDVLEHPADDAGLPSLRQSTSSSIASSRNLSISTGLPGMTSKTCRTTAFRSSSL
jgi:hypothetical protein